MEAMNQEGLDRLLEAIAKQAVMDWRREEHYKRAGINKENKKSVTEKKEYRRERLHKKSTIQDTLAGLADLRGDVQELIAKGEKLKVKLRRMEIALRKSNTDEDEIDLEETLEEWEEDWELDPFDDEEIWE